MGRPAKTTEEFVAECRAALGESYSYEGSVYTGACKPFTFRCHTHGTVTIAQANMHKAGVGGCPACKHARFAAKQRELNTAAFGDDLWGLPEADRAQRLREAFRYDANTGVLYRRKATSLSAKAGEAVKQTQGRDGYPRISIAGKLRPQHCIIWLMQTGREPTVIDHVNGVRHDNRWTNLRDVDQRTNVENRHAPTTNKTGLAGVKKSTKGCVNPWMARISSHGQEYHLGTFPTPEEAHAAYVGAKRVLHEGNTL